MKSDKLFDAIGELPDEYVQDARPATVLKKKSSWGIWLGAAACLLVAVLIVVPLLNGGANSADELLNAEITNEIVESTEVEEDIITSGASEPVSEEKNATTEEEPESAYSSMYGDITPATPPTSDDSTELPAGAVTEEEFEENNLASYTSLFGGILTYEIYLAGYQDATENPVFDALLNNYGTERFFASYASADNFSQWASIYVDGISSISSSLAVHLEHSDVYYEQEWKYFDGTGPKQVEVTNYEVDGVEIQKYFLSDIHYARISIDGEWYLVTGYDEAAVDDIAAELARIANEL